MNFKYRLTQPWYSFIILLTITIYCIVLLILFPIFFLGGLYWKPKDFWRMQRFMMNKIPKVPEEDED